MTVVLVVLGIIFVIILSIIALVFAIFSRIGIGGVIAATLASKYMDKPKKKR